MENVPDMALGDDMRRVRYMAERLEAIGYETDMRIVEAWRHGVPQHRQRLFFVGLRDGVFEWPKVLLTGRARGMGAASAYVAGYHLAMVAGAGIALVGAIASLTRPGDGKARRPTSGQA